MFGETLASLRSAFETPAPDGWFEEKLLWFGAGLGPATLLSRGARLDLPDLRSAGEETRESYYEGLGSFLASLSPDEAVQFQWRVDGDYHAELEAYQARTQQSGAQGWCAAVRQERYERYRRAQREGRLRREKLELFLSRRCTSVPKEGFRNEAQANAYVSQTAASFRDRLLSLGGHLPGARVSVYGDEDHYATTRAFLQPGLRLLGEERKKGRDPEGSILENCWPGGGITTRDTEGNVFFRLDGHYHALLVFRRWPMETHFGLIWTLTSALAANYCFTLNCLPLDTQREVEKTEYELRRLKGSRRNEDKESLDAVLLRKKNKITALQGGFARPFSVLAVLRVWDTELQGLLAQVQALKEAIASMGGAQCHLVDDEVQAKCLFYETMPGWTGGRYREWDLFALAGKDASVCFLQDLLPLSSSYHGHLDAGETLYDGDRGNLCGVRSFADGTPQHAVMIGTTRAGKSSQTIDYLSQTDCLFSFRAIIEEGLSYGTLVQLLGGESVVLNPDGDMTLNYFDTQGTLLTRAQVSSAAGLLTVMAGRTADPEVNAQRKALLAEYVEQLYSDAWGDFRRKFPQRELEAARLAWHLDQLRKKSQAQQQGLSLPELFADLISAQDRDALTGLNDGEALAYARRHETAGLVRDVGMSLLNPSFFPTHTALVETLKYSRLPHHPRELCDRLASQLAAWQRQGPHGKLFDGVTNRPLKNRLLHFELGLLSSSSGEMKEAVVYLLANNIRQRVLGMPRSQWKQFIFEEPSRYLKVGGMEDLLAEFYAQMGKFGCQILPVTQQYGQLSRSALRPVIFGNSKQYFMFRQNDRHDLDEIGEAIGLPPSARSTIRSFSSPEFQPKGDKFSQMAVFSLEGDRSECGVIHNKVSPEMLYVSASSGACFDERARALAGCEDLVAGVREEAAKMFASKPMEKR